MHAMLGGTATLVTDSTNNCCTIHLQVGKVVLSLLMQMFVCIALEISIIRARALFNSFKVQVPLSFGGGGREEMFRVLSVL